MFFLPASRVYLVSTHVYSHVSCVFLPAGELNRVSKFVILEEVLKLFECTETIPISVDANDLSTGSNQGEVGGAVKGEAHESLFPTVHESSSYHESS